MTAVFFPFQPRRRSALANLTNVIREEWSNWWEILVEIKWRNEKLKLFFCCCPYVHNPFTSSCQWAGLFVVCLFVCLFVCLSACVQLVDLELHSFKFMGKPLYSVLFSFVKNRSCVTQIYITKIAAKCILVVVVKWRHRAKVLFRWNQMRKLALKTREPFCDVRERTSVTSWSTLLKLTKFSYLKASGDTL